MNNQVELTRSKKSDAYIPLSVPTPCAEHQWPEGTVPLVSICCTTFNHESFIVDALDGFLMQETTFPVEILVHDDASTDRTADILRKYTARYPQLIKPIFQTENQYSQGNKPGRINRLRAQGEYLASCEGDDYWTNSRKLQVQIAALSADPTFSMSAHKVCSRKISEESVRTHHIQKKDRFEIKRLTGAHILSGGYLSTLSLVCRRSDWDSIPQPHKPIKCGDRFLFCMLATRGDVAYIDADMGFYRKHAGGVWSGATIVQQGVGMIEANLAVCRSIPSQFCLLPCIELARLCSRFADVAVRHRDISLLSLALFGYVNALILTVRNLTHRKGSVKNVIVTQSRVAIAPVRYFGGAFRIKINAFAKQLKTAFSNTNRR